jgi:hypothetical protein
MTENRGQFLTAIFLNSERNKSKMKLTLVIKKGKSVYLVGHLKELPQVFTQGKNNEELRENIKEALEMYLVYVN